MAVYFIQAGNNGPVKIGHSINVDSRVAALQTAYKNRLEVIRIIKNGGPQLEKYLHYYFRKLSINDEWFKFSPEMLTIQPEPVEVAKTQTKPTLTMINFRALPSLRHAVNAYAFYKRRSANSIFIEAVQRILTKEINILDGADINLIAVARPFITAYEEWYKEQHPTEEWKFDDNNQEEQA